MRLEVERQSVARTDRRARGGTGGRRRSTISLKNRSNPAGDITSRIRAGSSPAFQKVCH